MTFRLRPFLFGMFAMVLLLGVIGLVVVFTGSFDIAASDPHSAVGRWVLDTTFENALKRDAGRLDPPGDPSAAMLAAGAGEYKETCQRCHGGPGVEPDGWTRGMLPNPPELAKGVGDLSPAEVFWLVKHGVKMTGMPAFGSEKDDRSIWSIVAFVKALPKMPPAQYASYQAEDSAREKSGRG